MTSGLYPLLGWLRARVAETERVALATMTAQSDWGGWSARHSPVPYGFSDVVQTGRVYVVLSEVTPEAADHIALNDPAAALAQCEAHTKLLDLIVQSAVPEIKLKPGADEADYVAIFLDYKMHDFAVAVARAYKHHPEYAEQMAALKANPHEFQIARADDELSKRRNPPSPQ